MDITNYYNKFIELQKQCCEKGIDKLFPLSFSSMNTGITCPAKLNFQRLTMKEKRKSADPSAARIGVFNHILAHRTMEHAFLTDKTIESLEFDYFWPKLISGMTRDEILTAQEYRDDLQDMLEKLLNVLLKNKMDAFTEPTWGISREGKAFYETTKRQQKFLTGSIDLAGLNKERTRAFVLDYKTHSIDKQDMTELKRQLLTYIIFTTIKFPQLKSLTLAAGFISGNCIKVVEVLDTPEKFNKAFDEFFMFIEDFINNWDDVLNAVAKKNDKCKYCEYGYMCPLTTK